MVKKYLNPRVTIFIENLEVMVESKGPISLKMPKKYHNQLNTITSNQCPKWNSVQDTTNLLNSENLKVAFAQLSNELQVCIFTVL